MPGSELCKVIRERGLPGPAFKINSEFIGIVWNKGEYLCYMNKKKRIVYWLTNSIRT